MSTFSSIIDFLISKLLSPLVPIIIALAVVLFIWGMIQYILNSENAEKAQAGRTYMYWGLIALFVMTSVWGLVKFLGDTFSDVFPSTSGVINLDSINRDIFH